MALNEDGNPIAPRIEGEFILGPERSNAVNLIVSVSMQFPEAGMYSFRVNVDGHEMDVWELGAIEGNEQEQQP